MNIDKTINIIGCGGHSKVISNILLTNGYRNLNYYDDNLKTFNGYNVNKGTNDIKTNQECICAIGNNKIRKLIVDKNTKNNLNWTNVIDPFTSISIDLKIGIGNVICPGAIIQPNVIIGNHCIINTRSSVDHDCTLGSYVHIAPGVTLCGTVSIGDNTFIGAGTVIRNNIIIGKNVTIGCGSVVVKDIPDGVKFRYFRITPKKYHGAKTFRVMLYTNYRKMPKSKSSDNVDCVTYTVTFPNSDKFLKDANVRPSKDRYFEPRKKRKRDKLEAYCKNYKDEI